MVEAEYDGHMEMDPNEEEEYLMQQRAAQMQMQHPGEIYQDEYGNEVMMNPVGQIPMSQYENSDPTNALVSHSFSFRKLNQSSLPYGRHFQFELKIKETLKCD